MKIVETWRSGAGDYTVLLTDDFLEAAVTLARRTFPREVGTALVGSYSDDGTQATVTGVAPLSPDSKGSRFRFQRGVQGLRDFFSRLFRLSRGTVHYVGEWHSHPGGAPTPSRTDDNNMQEIADAPSALCPECILVILGLTTDESSTGVYVYSRTRRRLRLTRA